MHDVPADAIRTLLPGDRAHQPMSKTMQALNTTVHDPTDPMGKVFFNSVATFAEFEADLIKMHTREGMAIVKAKGKSRLKRPQLSEKQQKEIWRMYDTGEY